MKGEQPLLQQLEPLLVEAANSVAPAISLQINLRGEVIFQRALGFCDPETQTAPISLATRFDLASLTKLFTTTAVFRLIVQQQLALDTPVAAIIPEFSGQRPVQPYEDPLKWGAWVTVDDSGGMVDAGQVTIRQLLTHSSGLPAWRPIFKQPDEAKRPFVLNTFFSCRPDSQVVYSDLGFILLGWVIEAMLKRPLSHCFQELVITPLNLPNIGFGPLEPADCVPTEFCMWRQRRIHGVVHDENSYSLAGMAGHAGLFGTAEAAAGLGQAWLDVVQGESDFLPRGLAKTAVSLQKQSNKTRRGLGWSLWSPDPQSAAYSLSPNSFGHTGFTGTSLYVDPDRNLVVALLTNEVYRGRRNRRIGQFRVTVHEVIKQAIG